MTRYGVRVGDDGRWYLQTDSLDEARCKAISMSNEGWLYQGQIVDFETGCRETWRNGSKSSGGIS
jgi:hypothetical protein